MNWLRICCMVFIGLPFLSSAQEPKPADQPIVKPAGKDLVETWEAAYLSGTKVGYNHVLNDKVEVGGEVIVRVRSESKMLLKRFANETKLEMSVDSFEFSDGNLYEIRSRSFLGGGEVIGKGRLQDDGKFVLTINNSGKETVEKLEWGNDVLGPNATTRIVRELPKTPGASKKFRMFLSDMNKLVTCTVTVKGKKKTTLLNNRSADLHEIEGVYDGGLPNITLWTDEEGEVAKSEISMGPGLTVNHYRVSKAEALQGMDGSAPEIDLGFQTVVKPTKPLTNYKEKKRVRYRLTFSKDDAAEGIKASEHQRIVHRTGNEVVLDVFADLPKEPIGPSVEPAPEFLESNGFVQSQSPEIVKVAKEVTAKATTALEKCQALEQWVRSNITTKDFTVGFADANEVMQSKRGDCTEHSVLLAALMRAANIPSRVCIGLVYGDSVNGFAYHMWTEALVDGRWRGFDATLGLGRQTATHLKVGDSSLKGASAMTAFLPVFQVIGKMAIDTLEEE